MKFKYFYCERVRRGEKERKKTGRQAGRQAAAGKIITPGIGRFHYKQNILIYK